MDLITYALAQQAIAQYGASDAQIDKIETNKNNELVITLTDGREFKVQIPTVSPGVVTTLTETVNKVETQVQDLGLAIETSSKELAILKETAITQISVGETKIETINGELKLPLASGDVVGLIMAKIPADPENSVNSISINNETGYLEVNSLSVNKLIQEEGETLVLDCSQTF